MRIRYIKPGFWINEDLSECSPMARLLFIGLWNMADWRGRLPHRVKKIRAEIFPYDMDINVPDLLTELQRIDCIRVYGDGKYLWIPKFEEHQNPHPNEKKYASKCPDPNDLTLDVNDNVHGQERSGTSQAGSSGPSGSSGSSGPTGFRAKARNETDHAAEFITAWNGMAKQNNLPRCTVVSGKRAQALRTRLKEPHWRDNWKDAIQAIPGCPWLMGENKDNWKANADWFLKPGKVTALIEGSYPTGPQKIGEAMEGDSNAAPF